MVVGTIRRHPQGSAQVCLQMDGETQTEVEEVNEHVEERTVLQNVPFAARPVVETRYGSVVNVVNPRRRMSRVAVVALVVAAMAIAVSITMMIINGQQRNREEALARDQARLTATQQMATQHMAAQSAAQQALIVKAPPSQPAIVTAASPSRHMFDSGIATTSAGLEIEVTSLLQNDKELRRYAVFVKVTQGAAVLSGRVSDEDLKKRAERLAGTVTGIRSVINEIAVRP